MCKEQRKFSGGEATSEDPSDKAAAFVKRHRLTVREVDVLALLVTGKSNADIANSLSLSKKCIEHHLCNLYRKLGVKTHSNAMLGALKDGFVAKD